MRVNEGAGVMGNTLQFKRCAVRHAGFSSRRICRIVRFVVGAPLDLSRGADAASVGLLNPEQLNLIVTAMMMMMMMMMMMTMITMMMMITLRLMLTMWMERQ